MLPRQFTTKMSGILMDRAGMEQEEISPRSRSQIVILKPRFLRQDDQVPGDQDKRGRMGSARDPMGGTKTSSSSFLAELPRFENSRNVEMRSTGLGQPVFLLLSTNPRSPQSCAEATEDGGPSRILRRQRISEDRIQQFRDAAIGEGTFGQISS
jgi:hypothetical protein